MTHSECPMHMAQNNTEVSVYELVKHYPSEFMMRDVKSGRTIYLLPGVLDTLLSEPGDHITVAFDAKKSEYVFLHNSRTGQTINKIKDDKITKTRLSHRLIYALAFSYPIFGQIGVFHPLLKRKRPTLLTHFTFVFTLLCLVIYLCLIFHATPSLYAIAFYVLNAGFLYTEQTEAESLEHDFNVRYNKAQNDYIQSIITP